MLSKLIVVITHRCNLKCLYCPVVKDNSTINYNIAISAINSFLFKKNQNFLIRFFGGEPLLEFTLLKNIIIFTRNKAKELNKNVQFDVTTNGTLFSDKIVGFFKDAKDIELTISLDGDRYSQLRNRLSSNRRVNSFYNIISQRDKIVSIPYITINMVIAPNEAGRFYHNFLYILKLGFQRFNFLPAYFVYWSKEELQELRDEFRKIFDFIVLHKNKIDIYVKNLYVLSKMALFNHDLVVDCNGDIFANNLILSKQFSHLRNRLKIGNIKDFSLKQSSYLLPEEINYVIKEETDKKILESTEKADRILTWFVNSLKNETD